MIPQNDGEPPGKKISSQSSPQELADWFISPSAQALKRQMCELGSRMWQRAYVDGNGGNLAVRVGHDIALCTPTLISKGFMQPEDICLVDFAGNQLAGTKQRTSEILMHLAIMKHQPAAVATCHAHPPYATAFAITGSPPPGRSLPEFELFCTVGMAPYRTPGSPELGRLIAEQAAQHNTILMANHGVVTWSHNHLEEAYWRMEILESYCRTIFVARQLGQPVNQFTDAQMDELLKLKDNFGLAKPRSA